MRFLVIGLGSMGKRRIRCLQSLGHQEIFGFDLREDRREEAYEKYRLRTFSDIHLALSEVKPTALVISVPPDVHHEYIKTAIENKIHFFVEASVVDTDMDWVQGKLKETDIIAAPSATMLFHPAIKKISEVLKSKRLGKISNIVYHSGQYLPDWHTYEKVSEYYVSNPMTGGAREIVPFEMTWITHLFGFPKKVCANFRKTINIEGAEKIDDTYNILLDYENFLATMTIDVVSRYATRKLLINGDQKQLIWDWNLRYIQIYDPIHQQWENIDYEMKSAAAGYNPNIGEDMYVDELGHFIQAIEGKEPFLNTMENDHRVLKLLYAIEQADRDSKYVWFGA